MATSQNGWSVLSSPSQTHQWVIPGANRSIRLRPGHAGFVLAHFLLWFHEVIERIDKGIYDDWGWAYRAIRGKSTGFSNHASGTAVDIDATKHPLSARGTFKPWQYVRIRAHLLWMNGVIRWGADYSGRKDEMHFEINKGTKATYALAKRLANTPRGKRIRKANPAYRPLISRKPGTRDLKQGDRGEDVAYVQRRVGVTADGIYGPNTAQAVQRWERAQKKKYPGLLVDGVVGNITWRALGVKVKY